MSINDILNEKLCFNKNILLDSKPFMNTKLYSERLNIIYDILNPDLSFKIRHELNLLTVMEYNQIISAIPRELKFLMKKTNKNYQFIRKHDLIVKFGFKDKHILKIKCKDFIGIWSIKPIQHLQL